MAAELSLARLQVPAMYTCLEAGEENVNLPFIGIFFKIHCYIIFHWNLSSNGISRVHVTGHILVMLFCSLSQEYVFCLTTLSIAEIM